MQQIPEQEIKKELEPRQSIPDDIDLEFSVGSTILDRGSELPIRVASHDYRYGWIYGDVIAGGIKSKKQGDAIVRLKKETKKFFDSARNFQTGEEMDPKEKNLLNNWWENDPYGIIINVADLKDVEQREVLRDVEAGDYAEYFNMQFWHPETKEIIQVVDVDRNSRSFILRNERGEEKSLTPEEIFPTFEFIEEGGRIPMAGDTWHDKETADQRMKETETVKVNSYDQKRNQVIFTDSQTYKMVVMNLEDFRSKYDFESL